MSSGKFSRASHINDGHRVLLLNFIPSKSGPQNKLPSTAKISTRNCSAMQLVQLSADYHPSAVLSVCYFFGRLNGLSLLVAPSAPLKHALHPGRVDL
jgi:hypothetical protein